MSNRLSDLFSRGKQQAPQKMTSYGLETLFDPGNAKVDIVFVHGLHGHAKKTWTKDGVLWPKDLLPTDLQGNSARILTFGYDANVAHFDPNEVTQSRMENHATNLCAYLAALRSESETTERPIIFVSHSLGGLVCAQAIVIGDRMADGDNTQTIAEYTRGMIFLGTPFRGSSAAPLGERIRKIVNIFCDTNRSSLSDLDSKSETLRTLGEAFPAVLRKRDLSKNPEDRIRVVFFIETLKTSGVMVVDEDSACIPGLGEKASIRADHRDICKFDSKQQEGYKLILAALKKLMVEEPTKTTPSGGVHFNNYDKVINQAVEQTINGQVFNF